MQYAENQAIVYGSADLARSAAQLSPAEAGHEVYVPSRVRRVRLQADLRSFRRT